MLTIATVATRLVTCQQQSATLAVVTTTTHRLSAAEEQAWSAYRAMRLRLDATVARELEDSTGLSMPDYDVLCAVTGIEHGCVRVNALATRMLWSKSRLSRQLGRMERRGLIAREPCELDGRGDDVVITEAGRAALADAVPQHLQSVRTHFADRLSARQLAALTDVAETIVAPR